MIVAFTLSLSVDGNQLSYSWICWSIGLVFIWFDSAFQRLQNCIKLSRKNTGRHDFDREHMAMICLYLCVLSAKIECQNQLIWSPTRLVLTWFDRNFQALQNRIKISRKKHWPLGTIRRIPLARHDFVLFRLLFRRFQSGKVTIWVKLMWYSELA